MALAGCVVPESANRVYTGDRSVVNDKYLRVDPLEYPVFAVRQERAAPMDPNSSMAKSGEKRPSLKPSYRWEITHAFDGKYLAYSKEYDFDYCFYSKVRTDFSLAQRIAALPGLPVASDKQIEKGNRLCGPKANGHTYNFYIYLRPNGEAYGWQPLRNPKRSLFEWQKGSSFRVIDDGDWSGQPWFECVERCDKLANME